MPLILLERLSLSGNLRAWDRTRGTASQRNRNRQLAEPATWTVASHQKFLQGRVPPSRGGADDAVPLFRISFGTR